MEPLRYQGARIRLQRRSRREIEKDKQTIRLYLSRLQRARNNHKVCVGKKDRPVQISTYRLAKKFRLSYKQARLILKELTEERSIEKWTPFCVGTKQVQYIRT